MINITNNLLTTSESQFPCINVIYQIKKMGNRISGFLIINLFTFSHRILFFLAAMPYFHPVPS